MTAFDTRALLGTSSRRVMLMVAAIALITGCVPPSARQLPPAAAIEPVIRPSDFTIRAGELETWNAVGQLLVRLPGVTYQGRSQKLGLYSVDYQGDSFLVLTRALIASAEVRTLTTEVRVALQNGTPSNSAAAAELLGTLQARLPAELVRIAALPKPAVAKPKPVAKKRAIKRTTRK